MDGVEHLGLVRFDQRRHDGAEDMCARVLQARWTCLLLIDAGRDKEGKGDWEGDTLLHGSLAQDAGPDCQGCGVLRGGPAGLAQGRP